MKIFGLLALLLVSAVVAQDSSSSEESAEIQVLPLAEPCDQEACQLPDCRCSSTNIPEGLAARDTPQFVMLTFDDAVNIQNIETYREIIYGRRNFNGCPVGATFYVSHEYTNYQLVNELYNQGLEIALHSISHQNNQTYWAAATYEDMAKEFGDQRLMASHFANIPYDELKGIRVPFLQMTGNASFEVMKNYGLTYDASWPTTAFINPGLWPYSLDYATTQDCIIPPCPTASIPGVWVNPMISWEDLNGSFCSMADSCYWTPDLNDEDGWFHFIMRNFERHYLGNRAPFGFYVHEWYISTNVAIKNALIRFLDVINNVNDVYMVNSADVIEWTRDPKPLAEYNNQGCRQFTPTSCEPTTCPLESDHGWYPQTYWLAICNVCPRVYPWLGNPLGV